MQTTIPYRLLRRQQGYHSGRASVSGVYGVQSWVEDLDIVNELPGHTGCVNALSWSRSGRLLASGSDDLHVNIHSYQPDESTAPFKLATSVSTGHTSNIFSVKFMPHSNDRTVVSCAGDGDVRVFDVESPGSSTIPSAQAGSDHRRLGLNTLYDGVRHLGEADTNCRVYRSHLDRVKRIVTEASPHLFLTCSEDGEVRQWDLRQPSLAYPPPAGGRGFLAARRSPADAAAAADVPPPLISYARYHLDLNTISCSAAQPHYIALGGAHLHCFLHDRRMLGRDLVRERGAPAAGSSRADHRRQDEQRDQATQCVRRFAPDGVKTMKRTDNGHITACKISDYNPNEMVVSWSGDKIYSFDLVRSPDVGSAGPTTRSAALGRGAGDSRLRLRESRVRKRKREKTGSDGSGGERRRAGGSRPRSRSSRSSADPDGDLALRVRYGNGQTEDIPIWERPEVGRTLSSDRHLQAYDVARAVLRIRKELFDLRSRRRSASATTATTSSSSSSSRSEDDRRPFSVALRHAAAYLPIVDELIRTWRYPVNPTAEEVNLQRRMRRGRESTYRFVQAAGTAARVLGGRLRAAGGEENSALYHFRRVAFATDRGGPLERSDYFSYDFLRAIFAWLDGGRDGLLEAFTASVTDRPNHRRCPIPPGSDLRALDDILIPYLLDLAGDRAIVYVNPSRFERDEPETVFETERAAVTTFGRAVAFPLDDAARPAPTDIAGPSSAAPAGFHPRVLEDRQTATRFWALKVARGVLTNAAEDINSTFVVHAFGALERMSEEEARFLEVDVDPGRGRASRDSEVPAVTGTRTAEAEDGPQDTPNPAPHPRRLAYRLDLEDWSDDDSSMSIDEAEDTATEREESSGSSSEDGGGGDSHDDDSSDVGDPIAEEEEQAYQAEARQFFWATTMDRNFLRTRVEADVPCSSHTRTYDGHCNIETVKDVNFCGLRDEYVVSGSDGGQFFIWDKRTSYIVNVLQGDEDVVNVIQGHPYEPMLAVSGMDHTIKIFSPDRRAQYEARSGINVADGGSKRRQRPRRFWRSFEPDRRDAEHAAEPDAGEDRLERDGRGRGRASVTADPAGDDARSTTGTRNEDGDDGGEVDDVEVDVALVPARNGGLPSRRRLQDLYQIAAQNEQRRQGGMHDARLTRGMLAQLAARIRARHVDNAGNAAEGGENEAGTAAPQMTGDMEHIILEENCRVI